MAREAQMAVRFTHGKKFQWIVKSRDGYNGIIIEPGPIMTADKFRSLALEIPGATESSHMNHPDFRIGGRIFASLGYPDDDHGMVKLTPGQQQDFLKKAPKVFAPLRGRLGKTGLDERPSGRGES